MDNKKGLTQEEIKAKLESENLRIGRLRGELEEVVRDLKDQRKTVWLATLIFTEAHCEAMAKLWEIKAHRVHVKNELKKTKAYVKRLNAEMVEIGRKEYIGPEDDCDDDDFDDFDFDGPETYLGMLVVDGDDESEAD